MAELQKTFQNILLAILIAVNISGGSTYATWQYSTYNWLTAATASPASSTTYDWWRFASTAKTRKTPSTTIPEGSTTYDWWRLPSTTRKTTWLPTTSLGYWNGYPRVIVTSVRLHNGSSPNEGFVQLYANGEWLNVCGQYFRQAEAEVVCRSKGYPNGNSTYWSQYHYYSNQANTSLMTCYGGENSVRYCQTSVIHYPGYGCRYHAAWVQCENKVRLVNGSDAYSGRVEVYYQGRWGTVCDDAFDREDALVVCNMLNIATSYSQVSAYQEAIFGQGSGDIIIDDLHCTGTEEDIAECSSSPWLTHNCRHSEDAGVNCKDSVGYTTDTYEATTSTYVFGVRLTNGKQGLVEVNVDGRWGYICDSSSYAAGSVCRSLGYPSAVSGSSSYGNGYTVMSNLDCNGINDNLNRCSYIITSYSYRYCARAHVECTEKIRLVNGPDRYSGTVEVFYLGEWGTVCDDSFDRDDAIVICRMLGMYYSYSSVIAYSNAHFGSGSGNITIDDLNCRGNENDITNCSSNPWLSHNCNHFEDAGVDCRAWEHTTEVSIPETTVYDTRVRLVNGYDSFSGRVEISYNGVWRGVCRQGIGHNEVKVICRQLGMYYGDSYGRVYSYWSMSGRSLNRLSCYGYEYDVTGCNTNYWSVGACSNDYDAGINCHDIWVDQTSETPYITPIRTTMHTISQTIHVSCNENGWNIDVDMYTLRQIYPSAVESDIYLGENSCTGTEYYGTLRFRQGFGQCLTNEIVKNDVLVYSNALIYAQHDRNHPFIIKSFNWTIPVECDVEKNATSNGHLHHIEHAITAEPPVVGYSKYAVNMTFYQDPNFAYEMMGNPLQVKVGSKVYVKIFTPAADWNIKMRVHTCYAKPTADAPEHLKYYIIKNGCEVDANTHIVLQYAHETRFVFQDFEYTNNHEGIFLYCDANFCDSNDYSSGCSQTCHNIVRRGSGVQTP